MKPLSRLRVALIGAGARGFWLARLLREQAPWASIAAVAEPRAQSRAHFAAQFSLPPAACFEDWSSLLKNPPACDAAIIATMDRDHRGPVEACLKLGWHLLLEKPLSPLWEDCLAMAGAEARSGAVVAVCHSLRYHRAFQRCRQIADSGRLGRLMGADLLEQVGFWHFAHSFVRGNWAREGDSSFSLLAKSCHDLDYLAFLAQRPCLRASSFGSLGLFRADQAPAGAAARCLDCALKDCAFDARRLYQSGSPAWGFVLSRASTTGEAPEEAAQAMIAGPLGRCAWRCHNDVADHQTVNLEFADDFTATFTLSAFTADCSRRLRLQGSGGELEMQEEADGQRIRVREFASGRDETEKLEMEEGAHGGADARLVAAWLECLRQGDPALNRSSIAASLQGHAMAFAAEEARKKGMVAELGEWLAKPGGKEPGPAKEAVERAGGR